MSKFLDVHITYHGGQVTREQRENLLRQKGATLWFTGLSASGKSTIAAALEHELVVRGHAAYMLDGDNVRFGLNAAPKLLSEQRSYSPEAASRFGLGFSAVDRQENIRRIGEVAKLFADAGLIAITSFISPYRADRDAARAVHAANSTGPLPFIEIHVNTPIEVCEQRDPKGLYKKAREALAAGKGMGFTGVDDPYEAPLQPELVVPAHERDLNGCVQLVLEALVARGIVRDQ